MTMDPACTSTPVVASPPSFIGNTPLKIKGAKDRPAITRLHLQAAGPTLDGDMLLAETYLESLTVDGRYLMGSPLVTGLPGTPLPSPCLLAIKRWMEDYGPTVPVLVSSGEALALKSTNENDGGVIVMAAERTAQPETFAANVVTDWLGVRAAVASGVTDHRIEIPGTRGGGTLTGLGIARLVQDISMILLAGFSTPSRVIVPPVPLTSWEAWGRAGHLPAAIGTAPGEPLYLTVTSVNGWAGDVSLAGEWVRPYR